MKKILFLATVFVAGAATAGIAQLSGEGKENNVASDSRIVSYQDTTKPTKDSIPEKKDSASFRY